jgi:DNA-binding transcriptional regulator YdaS (Cro superfamily)
MDLATYLIHHDGKLDREGVECARLAKAAETTPYYLCMLARGFKKASPELAIRIAHASIGGAVLKHELRNDIWDTPKPAKRAA